MTRSDGYKTIWAPSARTPVAQSTQITANRWGSPGSYFDAALPMSAQPACAQRVQTLDQPHTLTYDERCMQMRQLCADYRSGNLTASAAAADSLRKDRRLMSDETSMPVSAVCHSFTGGAQQCKIVRM